MDVINMRVQILLVIKRMLPKTALPYGLFPSFDARIIPYTTFSAQFDIFTREAPFNLIPAH